MATKKDTRSNRQKMMEDFGATEQQLQGATEAEIAEVLADLMGPGAQVPTLSAHEQMMLDAARRHALPAENDIGMQIASAIAGGQRPMPEDPLRMLPRQSAVADDTRVAGVSPFRTPTNEPIRYESGGTQDLGRPGGNELYTPPDPIQELIASIQGGKQASERPQSKVRGGDKQLDVLEILGLPQSEVKKGDEKGDEKKGGFGLADLLPVLGVGVLGAVLAARRGGSDRESQPKRHPVWGSLERGQSRTIPKEPGVAERLGDALNVVGQTIAARQEQKRQEQQFETQRKQDLGMAFLRAGHPAIAMKFLGENNAELQDLSREEIANMSEGRNRKDFFQLFKIAERIGGPEVQRVLMEEAFSMYPNLTLPAGAEIIASDQGMPLTVAAGMQFLKMGIDPGPFGGLDQSTRNAYIEQYRARYEAQSDQDRLKEAKDFAQMLSDMNVAGTDPELIDKWQKQLQPKIQEIADRLGVEAPLPGELEAGGAAPKQQTEKLPTDVVISNLQEDAPFFVSIGRAATEQLLKDGAADPGDERIRRELDRIFR